MSGAAAFPRPLRCAPLRCLALVATLAVALLAHVPGSASAAPSDAFGVNAGGVMDLPADLREAHLAAIAAAGLETVRVDAAWGIAERDAPNPHHVYRWERFDEIAGAFARHGLRWYPLLAYSTEWSGRTPGDIMSAPSDPAQYAAFARAFAARYGTNGAFWREHPELPARPTTHYEIWNEPNARQFWRTQETAPEEYADLYLAARAAIKEVDPAGQVVTAGLLDANAGDVHEFVRRAVRHRPELRALVDAVGYHPYQQDYYGIYEGIRAFRRTMSLVGLGAKPLEITEIGMTTAWVSERTRAETLARLARELPASGLKVSRFMPFNWLAAQGSEHGVPSADDPDKWWGIVRRDTSKTPTATAYIAAVRSVDAAVAASPKRLTLRKKAATKAKRRLLRSRDARAKRRLERRRAAGAALPSSLVRRLP